MRNIRTTIKNNESILSEIGKKKIAVGYVRVSTDSQADIGHSIDAQISKIKSYCQSKDIKLIKIERDEGVSGTTQPESRHGLGNVLRLIEKGKANCLVVVKNDRLARRASYQKNIIYSLVDRNVEFISISENIDTSTATGKLFLSLLAEFAEFEVELIRERTRNAIQHLKNNGRVHCREWFGYSIDMIEQDEKLIKVWKENEREQKIIREVIQLYDSGLSWRRVEAELTKNYGRKVITHTTARRVYLDYKGDYAET